MQKPELRFYTFVNFYLSSIQQGIQTGHAAVQLLRDYQCLSGEKSRNVRLVEEWADNHKTFITLNGGNSAGVKEATRICEASGFPYVKFFEDTISLDGVQTCVGIVLPETVFNAKANRVNGEIVNFEHLDDNWMMTLTWPDNPRFELIKLVTSARLAQ